MRQSNRQHARTMGRGTRDGDGERERRAARVRSFDREMGVRAAVLLFNRKLKLMLRKQSITRFTRT